MTYASKRGAIATGLLALASVAAVACSGGGDDGPGTGSGDAGPGDATSDARLADSSAPDARGDASIHEDAGGGDATTDANVTPDAPSDVTIADVVVEDASDASDAGHDAAPPTDARLVFVHAAPDAPPFRICYSQGVNNDGSDAVVAPLPPLPDATRGAQPFPGVFPGAPWVQPDITDLSSIAITAYVLSASNPLVKAHSSSEGALEPDCTKFIGTKGDGAGADPTLKLTPNVDYWRLATIPSGTLLNDATFLLALTGCLPQAADAGGSAALCGADYQPVTGNLALGIATLDTTTPAGAGIGAQFAHRSTAFEGLAAIADGQGSTLHAPASRGVVPGFLVPTDAGTGSVFVALQQAPVAFSRAAVAPTTANVLGPSQVDPRDPRAAFGVLILPSDGGAPSSSPWPRGDLLSVPLGDVVLASPVGGDAGATTFAPGSSYTFALVGDPTQTFTSSLDDAGNPVPTGSPLGVRIVAVPNVFVAPPLQ